MNNEALTLSEYEKIQANCRGIFISKGKDYGFSWRVMRIGTMVDQLWIKAKRIRSIEENGGNQAIVDPIIDDYYGLINYAIMALVQVHEGVNLEIENEQTATVILQAYDREYQACKDLMLRKNKDYGEAWREMAVSSITDMILARIMRMRQIIKNEQSVVHNESMDNNLIDIVNYASFACITLSQ